MASSLFHEPENKQQENNMFQQFLYFKNQLGNKDPKTIVEQLISNGQMTREQFNALSSQVSDFLHNNH